MKSNFLAVMKRIILGAVIALAIFGGTQDARATQMVINGGFETGDLTGWTLTDSGDHQLSQVYQTPTNQGSPHSGTSHFSGFENYGSATLSQVIGTTAGTTYDFSFWYSYSWDFGNILAYRIGEGAYVTVPDPAAHLSWTQSSSEYLATSSSTMITLRFETDPRTGTHQIDDVSFREKGAIPSTPVPDNGTTLALFGIALLGPVWCPPDAGCYGWLSAGADTDSVLDS